MPFLVLTLVLLLAAACSAGSSDVKQDAGPTATPVPSIDQRIVYVSEDFVVFTATSEGRDRSRVVGSGDGLDGVQARLIAVRSQDQTSIRYTWPTWSPDGTRVAISRAPGADDGSVASLVLIGGDASMETELHETRNGPVPQVAPGAYHYTYWSPDGGQIGLIAPRERSQGLSLFRLTPDDGTVDEVLQRAPLYVSWSPDSTAMLVHRREQLFLHDAVTGETEDLDLPSQLYRVPDFNSDGTQFAYVTQDRLYARTIDTGEDRELLGIENEAAFMYSPRDPHKLAATTRFEPEATGFLGLDLIDTETGEAT